MSRLKEAYDVLNHKYAFWCVRNNNSFLRNEISLSRALMHDLEKLVLILLIGDRLATKFHRWFAGHHQSERMNWSQKVEAFCDWESARYTKPEKPLNGFQTWRKYYKGVDMDQVYAGYLIGIKKRKVHYAM